jgi:multiple sugar transport system substrate-binding protein
MKWIFTILIILFLFISPALSGKSNKLDQKKEIRFWHSIGTYNKDILNSSVSNYNEINRPASVIGEFQGNEDALYSKLFSQEIRPDIIQIPVQFLASLHANDYLVELTPLIPNKMKEDIDDKFWNSVSIKGGIYGVPFIYDVRVLFVNQHILRISGVKQEKVPKSWADILSASEKIKAYSRKKWALFIPMNTIEDFIAFVQSYTGIPIIQEGRMNVHTAESVSAMEFLQGLVYEQELIPSKISIDEGESLFLSGNLGIMLSRSSMLVFSESNLPYDMNVWHLPSYRDVPPLVTGSCLALLKSNPRREREAYKFIDYLVDYETAINWHTHTGNPAIRTSVKQSLDLLIFYEDNPNHMASAIELDRGEIFNLGSDYLNINTVVKEALEEIMINGEDPDTILFRTQKEIDSLSFKDENSP